MDSLVEPLYDLGWHISLAGSVARCGIGRDLDLVITPTFSSAAPVAMIVGTLIANHDDWVCIDTHVNSDLRGFQMLVETGDNHLIDFYIGNEPPAELRSEIALDIAISDGWGMGC